MPSHGSGGVNVATPSSGKQIPSRSKDREGIFCVRAPGRRANISFFVHSRRSRIRVTGTPRCLLRKAAKKPATASHAAAVAPLSLVCQQRHLALHSAGIAPERTARTHNPVTRHENRNGVASHRTRHGAHTHRRARPSVGHAERQVTIRQGRGERHVEQLTPHGQLKWSAAQIEIRQGRQWQNSREVSAQPLQRGLDKGRQIRNRRVRPVPFQGNALRPGFRLVRRGAMAFALEP